MRKKFNAIISVVLTLALAVTGVSYVSLKNAEADTVAALKTIKFDDESDIIAKNDSAAAVVDDAERGKVISLGAGDATKDLVGAQLTNPWADATVNPEGAKEYTVDDIKYAYNYALGIPFGTAFRDTAENPGVGSAPSGSNQYLIRAEGDGGVTWRSLTVAEGVPLQNGAVAENTEKSINDSTGNYRGAEHAQSVMGDTYASTRIKRDGKEVELSDGTKAAVSAYKVEKEEDYVRPLWTKEDGLTMSVWVKAPEGTEADTVLFSFFNDRIVEAMDAETANFNNKTGHFTVRADGSVEFMELSHYAGDPNEPANSQKTFGRYAASRNRFTSPAIGTDEGVNVLANPGEWVCVTLVVENDYVSVYFDGIQVNYIESYVVTGDTDEGKFTQDWENPENSPSWVRAEMETLVKTFNGWFGSRNTPTYVLVNSGVYAGFPKWNSRSARKNQPYPVADCEGGATLINKPRITLCQWLQDSATTLYLGGSANKNLNAGTYDEATGVTTYDAKNCEKQYKLIEGTMFDDIEFYGEALTAEEVAATFVNAGGTLEATPEPTESEDPVVTATPEPTESEDPVVTDTPVPTESEDPVVTDTPVPTESEDPVVTDTPVPTESEDPVVTDTPTPVIQLGDVDDDGDVDAADALEVLKFAAKLQDLDEDAKKRANVDDVESIDAADALLILKKAAKLIDEF